MSLRVRTLRDHLRRAAVCLCGLFYLLRITIVWSSWRFADCGACKSLCISFAKPLAWEIVLWCVLWHVAIPTGAWFCTLGSLNLHFVRCVPSRSSQGFCCHSFRWRPSDFTYYDRATYSVISTERSEWRNLPTRPVPVISYGNPTISYNKCCRFACQSIKCYLWAAIQ